ncbi:hypothetical protein AVEN_219368-1 [Araneus ventricosus]|uniref:Uncharacterized protein n=1 Tax=Araneus ventricosus TaxID=182803 RepID=A0A4Y2BG36_ARAVE|nr:hypothetical protein AVEN_219368-1 [Araneus ventricosus]
MFTYEKWNMLLGKHLTDCEKWRVIGRMENEDLKVTKSVITRISKQFKIQMMYADNHVKLKKHATADFQDCYLPTIAERNRQLMAAQISREFVAATGTRLSRYIVSDMLHKRGLFARDLSDCL